MTRIGRAAVLWFAWAGVAAFGQPPARQAPIAGNPKTEIKGRIEKIQIARGHEMPYLEVRTPNGVSKVFLGSVRYLIEQDFNPKAGDELTVKGYKMTDSVVAITVTLTSTGKVLKLRDDDGRPVWMRGRRGGPR
jgi:hypothetical protein